MYPTPTGVRRYACRDFTGPDIVEKGNILAKHCLKVGLSDTLRVDLASIHPHLHVKVRATEHSDTFTTEVNPGVETLMIETRTNEREV